MLGGVGRNHPQAVSIAGLIRPGVGTRHIGEGLPTDFPVEPVTECLAVPETVMSGQVQSAADGFAAGPPVLEGLVWDVIEKVP